MAKKPKNVDKKWLSQKLGELYKSRAGDFSAYTYQSPLSDIAERIYEIKKYRDHYTESSIYFLTLQELFGLGTDQTNSTYADHVIDALDNTPKEFEALIPLGGISIHDDLELTIGNVIITSLTDKIVKRHSNKFHSISATESHCVWDETGVRSKIKLSSTVALVKSRAHPLAQKDFAFSILEEAINYLRFFMWQQGHDLDSVAFGFGDHYIHSNIDCSILDISSMELTHKHSQPDEGFIFNISQDNISYFNDRTFKLVSEIIKQPLSDLSDIERRIRIAASLFGKARQLKNPSYKFLLTAIGIETLLSFKDSDLTEHLALCISKICGKDKDERHRIYKKAKGLYQKRSEMVHSGEFFVFESELMKIDLYASEVFCFATEQLSNFGRKCDWPKTLNLLKVS